MSTDSSSDTPQRTETSTSTDTDPEYYFEDIPEALDELEYFQERYETATETLTTIHDQLETVDCDIGCATASFDDASLHASMFVPTLNGVPDEVIKQHSWDTVDIDYDKDTELYSVTLETGFPLFARLLDMDYKSENDQN